MSEAKHTPAPWRFRTTGNMGNCIEADSGKRYNELDDGFRPVAMYQECCATDNYFEQRANCDANGAFIVKAVNNHDALVTALEVISSFPITDEKANMDAFNMRELARAALASVRSAK